MHTRSAPLRVLTYASWKPAPQHNVTSLSTRLHTTSHEVHVVTCPLVGWERIAQRMGPLFPDAAALHYMVLVRGPADDSCSVYDFLPAHPESAQTAARLLSGQTVPGAEPSAHLSNQTCWSVRSHIRCYRSRTELKTGRSIHFLLTANLFDARRRSRTDPVPPAAHSVPSDGRHARCRATSSGGAFHLRLGPATGAPAA